MVKKFKQKIKILNFENKALEKLRKKCNCELKFKLFTGVWSFFWGLFCSAGGPGGRSAYSPADHGFFQPAVPTWSPIVAIPRAYSIRIPHNDPFYAQYKVDCMEFVRSQPAPRTTCELGMGHRCTVKSTCRLRPAFLSATEKNSFLFHKTNPFNLSLWKELIIEPLRFFSP